MSGRVLAMAEIQTMLGFHILKLLLSPGHCFKLAMNTMSSLGAGVAMLLT